MCTDDITLVPLCARDGSIRAYALIDTAEASWVLQHRWGLDSRGYAHRSQDDQTLLLHREMAGMDYGDPLIVDHVNRVRLDCRMDNLRILTKGQNAQNRVKRDSTTSNYLGVTWIKPGPKHRTWTGAWLARVRVNGRRTSLGLFSSEKDAAEAVRVARLKYLDHATD